MCIHQKFVDAPCIIHKFTHGKIIIIIIIINIIIIIINIDNKYKKYIVKKL
jgi:uncharacterized protein involved in outer membrane biogenesis